MKFYKKGSKGFTLVELIVVIAIIGILTAIMVPVLSNSGKPEAANAKAKSFYYAAQSTFINYKSENVNDMTEGYFTISVNGTELYATDAGKFLYVEAKAEQNKGFTELTLSVSKDDTIEPELKDSYMYMNPGNTETRQVKLTSGGVLDKLNGFSTGDEYGYYYALIDSQCRVRAAYWSEDKFATLSNDTSSDYGKSQVEFTDNYIIDYSVVGAFPTEKGSINAVMFDV